MIFKLSFACIPITNNVRKKSQKGRFLVKTVLDALDHLQVSPSRLLVEVRVDEATQFMAFYLACIFFTFNLFLRYFKFMAITSTVHPY